MKAYRKRKAQDGKNNRNDQAPAALSVMRNAVQGLLYYVDQLRIDELQRLTPDKLVVLSDRLGSAKALVCDVINGWSRAS